MIPWGDLPRQMQQLIPRHTNADLAQSLIHTSTERTKRLVSSFDELEIEVQDDTSMLTNFSFRLDHGDWATEDSELWRTLDNARKARVPETELTKDFIGCRRLLFDDEGKESLVEWQWYKRCRKRRHAWSPYLRSNLDWDLDVTNAMKRMFKLPAKRLKPTSNPAARSSHVTNGAPEVDISSESSWKIIAGPAPRTLPKEVQIAYTTQTGTTKFKTFFAESSVEDFTPLCDREKEAGKALLGACGDALIIKDHVEAESLA